MAIVNFEDLQEVSKGLKTCDIKGKQYVQVNERVKAFRKLFPDGKIETDLLKLNDGFCLFKATLSIGDLVLATGHAYEREGTSNINKTSFIENCETSAIGRALAFLGIGIDLSIASAEEVDNAIEQQTTDLCVSAIMVKTISNLAEEKGVELEAICNRYKIEKIEDLKARDFTNVMEALKKTKGKE